MLESFSSRPTPQGIMANAIVKFLPDSAMPPKKTERFQRTARLLRHADFERVYKAGRRHFSQSMTVFYLSRSEEKDSEARTRAPAPHSPGANRLRVGFTVGRTLGGAVQRNRMKRRLREAVRISLPAGNIAVDVVINPKRSVLNAEFTGILSEVRRAFAKIEQEFLRSAASGGRRSDSSESNT
jgi:ribonuclease P protein component